MCFGVGAYIHYEWSLLLAASLGREEQAGDCDMNCGGTEMRREEKKGEKMRKKSTKQATLPTTMFEREATRSVYKYNI